MLTEVSKQNSPGLTVVIKGGFDYEFAVLLFLYSRLPDYINVVKYSFTPDATTLNRYY